MGVGLEFGACAWSSVVGVLSHVVCCLTHAFRGAVNSEWYTYTLTVDYQT